MYLHPARKKYRQATLVPVKKNVNVLTTANVTKIAFAMTMMTAQFAETQIAKATATPQMTPSPAKTAESWTVMAVIVNCF